LSPHITIDVSYQECLTTAPPDLFLTNSANLAGAPLILLENQPGKVPICALPR